MDPSQIWVKCMHEKKEIRKQIFKLREEVSKQQIILDSHKITEKIIHMRQFAEAPCIFAYMDVRGEVMTRELIRRAWDENKKVAVPKVLGESLKFYYITEFSQCTLGCLDIPEPDSNGSEAVCDGAFMIMPGMAFDRQRHRVGYGGGYYDRYLEKNRCCICAAVAFSWQVQEHVPYNSYDIIPDYLITEKEIIG